MHGNQRHGHKRGYKPSPEYLSWMNLRRRCLNPSSKSFASYGGAGVTVCRRWSMFDNFIADMGPKPTPTHQIERVDNSGNYEPGNCRWATPVEQANNRRSNVWITHNGKTQTIAQWAAESGLKLGTLWYRLYRAKWPFEKAITTPIPDFGA